jgi:hypothetical protein
MPLSNLGLDNVGNARRVKFLPVVLPTKRTEGQEAEH